MRRYCFKMRGTSGAWFNSLWMAALFASTLTLQPVRADPVSASKDAQIGIDEERGATNSRSNSNRQERGRLTSIDRFGKKTVIEVLPAFDADPKVRRYTSGDATNEANEAVSVRVCSYVGSVADGKLWKFPLRGGSSGAAALNFGANAPGSIRWKVDTSGDDKASIEAEVVIPGTFSSWSGSSTAHLSGKWKAEFDSTWPIPVRSELSARPNVPGQTSELSVCSWVPDR